jgi:hypothetical protein
MLNFFVFTMGLYDQNITRLLLASFIFPFTDEKIRTPHLARRNQNSGL